MTARYTPGIRHHRVGVLRVAMTTFMHVLIYSCMYSFTHLLIYSPTHHSLAAFTWHSKKSNYCLGPTENGLLNACKHLSSTEIGVLIVRVNLTDNAVRTISACAKFPCHVLLREKQTTSSMKTSQKEKTRLRLFENRSAI